MTKGNGTTSKSQSREKVLFLQISSPLEVCLFCLTISLTFLNSGHKLRCDICLFANLVLPENLWLPQELSAFAEWFMWIILICNFLKSPRLPGPQQCNHLWLISKLVLTTSFNISSDITAWTQWQFLPRMSRFSTIAMTIQIKSTRLSHVMQPLLLIISNIAYRSESQACMRAVTTSHTPEPRAVCDVCVMHLLAVYPTSCNHQGWQCDVGGEKTECDNGNVNHTSHLIRQQRRMKGGGVPTWSTVNTYVSLSPLTWHLHTLVCHMPEDLTGLITTVWVAVTAVTHDCPCSNRNGLLLEESIIWERLLHVMRCVTGWLWACCDSLCCRRARFKRSNSVTASVQADLDPEGFPGLSIAVPTQDKSLQFGCSFQRHSSEPESASQYTECHRTVHTQGQWAYREVGLQWYAKLSPESSLIKDGVLVNFIQCFSWKKCILFLFNSLPNRFFENG